MELEKLCFKCKSTKFRRVNRMGFLQTTLLPYFGYFPWECVMCRRKTYFRDSGHKPIVRGSRA